MKIDTVRIVNMIRKNEGHLTDDQALDLENALLYLIDLHAKGKPLPILSNASLDEEAMRLVKTADLSKYDEEEDCLSIAYDILDDHPIYKDEQLATITTAFCEIAQDHTGIGNSEDFKYTMGIKMRDILESGSHEQ